MKSWCWGPPRLWLLDHSWEAQSISSPPAPHSGPRKCPRAHGDMCRPPVTPEAGDSGREQRDIKASAACPPPHLPGKCLALLCHQFGGHRWRESPQSWPLAPGFTWPWASPPPQHGPLDLSVTQAGASPLTASVLGEEGHSILFLKLKKYYFIITAFTKTNVERTKTLRVPISPRLGLTP